MPRDLFNAANRRDPRTRQSSVVVVSALMHAALVAALIVASMLLPGVIPHPHAATVWDGPRLIRLADIPLPPKPPSPRRTLAPASSSAGPSIPVVAPDGVHEEQALVAPEPGVVPGPDTGVGDTALGDGTALPSTPQPVRPPQGPVRMHSGIEAPRKVHDVTPLYPALARTAGASGVVIIEATIDAQGDVVAAKVLRSIPMLDDAAVTAVRQWKFTPARLNGEPVAVLITVTINFSLAH